VIDFWLSVTTRENFDGGPTDIDAYLPNCEKRVEAITIGDKFISYIVKECVFGNIYEATSINEPSNNDLDRLASLIYPDEKREGKKKYSLMFFVKPILIPCSNQLLDAKGIFVNSPYIKNPNSWGWYVHHSLRNISKDEFRFIELAMRKSRLYQEVNP
jgi:hypothetical protein